MLDFHVFWPGGTLMSKLLNVENLTFCSFSDNCLWGNQKHNLPKLNQICPQNFPKSDKIGRTEQLVQSGPPDWFSNEKVSISGFGDRENGLHDSDQWLPFISAALLFSRRFTLTPRAALSNAQREKFCSTELFLWAIRAKLKF